MGDVARVIEAALAAIDRNSFGFLVALSGVGIVTMALLQLFKDLLPSRRVFQRRWFNNWLTAAASAQKLGANAATTALQDLVGLATAGDDKALFDLPVEQFTGQFNAAVQAVLDQPDQYQVLVRLLAQRANPKDLKTLFVKKRPTAGAALEHYMEARNRVSRQIQRTLDAVQIAMSNSWKRLLHWLSVVISAAIIGAALTIYGGPEIWQGPTYGYALAVALLGAFIAPVARDLVSAIQNLRSRP
jgi:hypothetical protein